MTFWCGSMPLTNVSGSGSCYFRHWPSRCPQKTNFLTRFFLLVTGTFWRYISLHYFSKITSQKESQNSRIQGFSYYFCMMIEGSGSGSIPLTGSGRQKTRGSGTLLSSRVGKNPGFFIKKKKPAQWVFWVFLVFFGFFGFFWVFLGFLPRQEGF